jgi:hypothetical protein
MAIYQKRGNAERDNRPEPPKVAWDRVFEGRPFQGPYEGALERPRRFGTWEPEQAELYRPVNRALIEAEVEHARSEEEARRWIEFAEKPRPAQWELVTISDGSRWWILTEALRRSHRAVYLIFTRSHSGAEAPRGLKTTAQLLGAKS